MLARAQVRIHTRKIEYALIGGFALSLWGVPRTTVDIDFLVQIDDMKTVHEILESVGYERVFHSANVSQYTSPLAVFGELDFIHALRKASLGMLKRSERKEIFGGRQTVRVLAPEDLIGLKVQAMANNPDRTAVDRADIESLMALFRKGLDWDRIREYFGLFEMGSVAEELMGKYCASQ